jgi:hypothetical protein
VEEGKGKKSTEPDPLLGGAWGGLKKDIFIV